MTSHVFQTLVQVHVSGCGKSHNVRMFAERFERDGIVHLVIGVPVVVKGNEFGGI